MQQPDQQKKEQWLAQFRDEDRALAALMLDNLLTVTSDVFVQEMDGLIRCRVSAHPDNVGLYIETERRRQLCKITGKKKPDRLFKESRGKHKRSSGSGPSVIRNQNNARSEVGSEGVLAQLATQIFRQNRSSVCINPGPDRIRKSGSPVRRFILLTDFIGSGDRVYNYLDSAWRLRSVRSWWSRRPRAGLSFEVLAYSATEQGIKRVESHPCGPRVEIVTACPTIYSRFNARERGLLVDLCQRYTADAATEYTLGYGDAGALIAFHHGVPNNAPGIFWAKTTKWKPLFLHRVTSSTRHTFSSDSHVQDRAVATLDALGLRQLDVNSINGLPVASVNELLVLASLRRSPRTLFAISSRSGIELAQVETMLEHLKTRQLIDQSHHLTTIGRHYLLQVMKENPKVEPEFNISLYYPTQLRAPKEPS